MERQKDFQSRFNIGISTRIININKESSKESTHIQCNAPTAKELIILRAKKQRGD
jgi:hypothetical protein